jgi:hypothetical protein
MQPQQPYYPPAGSPAPQNPGQFDFIVNNSAPSRGPNKKTLLLFGLGAALLVIVLGWIILSLAFGGNNSAVTPLVNIAQEQNEIVRVSKLANTSGSLSSQNVRNFAVTTQLAIQSDQTNLVAFIGKNGKKLNEKQLGVKQKTSTDSALDAAKTTGTYDTTYLSIMQTGLKNYQLSLQQTYQKSTSRAEKELLKKQYDNATLILQLSQ